MSSLDLPRAPDPQVMARETQNGRAPEGPPVLQVDNRSRRCRSAELLDLRRARALLAVDDLELDAGALGERAVAVALDVRVVHEQVATVLGRDEAEALRVVEPLN